MKALPLNPNIFTKGGLLGVPAKVKYSVTVPHSPKLATRERAMARNKIDECETQPIP